MKKFSATAIIILVVAMSASCFAYETDFDDLRRFDRNLPQWKLGRGFVNILNGPGELFTSITNNAIEGNYYGAYDEGIQGAAGGALNGAIAGVIPGVYNMMRRMTTGALEILTFWKPEYGPTMDPTWATRCRAWGEQDFYDPHPFWYTGPDR
jgi:putative exosortase-associated protein (TIGR04073 family)